MPGESGRSSLPRNAEVIRQWSLLRDLESSRSLTIDDMATRTGVTTRTIRRDLEALQEAGFPLFDEVHDGKRYWTTRAARVSASRRHRLQPRRAERALLHADAGRSASRRRRSSRTCGTPSTSWPAALTPGMRQFLDRLPLAIQAKADPGVRAPAHAAGRSPAAKPDPRVAQLLDATLHHRRVEMRYHSFSSNRDKAYAVEPQRLVFAQGGLYLLAFVPEYDELRTFSVDRILGAVADRGSIRAPDALGRCVRAFARRPQGHARARRDRLRAADEPLRPGSHLAPVADGSKSVPTAADPEADGLERLGAAELDPRLRRARPRARAGGAGSADPRRGRAHGRADDYRPK